MSTVNAPCCTRLSNATTQPGQIVLDAQVKRRTKAQKNADDLALKEAKEAQTQKGLERLAGMQNEMEQAQEELLTKKTAPVQPKPRAHKVTKLVVGNGNNHTGSLMDADEADSHQEAVKNMGDETAGAKKRVMKKGGKPLIRDAISNMQGKISEASSKVEGDNAMTRVSDGKDAPTPHINASTQKIALGGRMSSCVSRIKKSESRSQRAPTGSTSTQAPPTTIFSQGTASTMATSDLQVPIRKPVANAQIPDAEVLIGSFADDIDDTLECEATIAQSKGKSKVASIFDDNSAPFTQVDNPLKQKACVDELINDNKESIVSEWSMDIEGPDLEDAIKISDDAPEPEPVVVKKEKVQCTTSLTSVSVAASVADSQPPAQKKVKVKPSTTRANGAPAIKRQLNMDTTPDHMKPHGTYRNVDLPATMQVDQCWTKKYLPTVMLWAGSYDDIWNIPDEVLLLHAQLIFNAVYKDLNITIVHGGVIHSLTAQLELAKSLIAGYAFLFEDPEKPSPLMTYCSPFVLQLLGTAHLNAINGYVEVPRLDTCALTTHGMLGVIALSAAADLEVNQVLASRLRGKLALKLPKVLNKTTGKMTNAPFLFSGAHWTKATTLFIKSIMSKPAGYVETTVEMARACSAALNNAMDTPHGSLDDEESEDDERAMLCK
ncbi:uncharacterized protein F5891DRAFT_1181506 [Suillus fuscotomentosus]|uniref:Uncharacterized protein n=1 Tax=Suillus fuscotomentosus TaxID=1912939 RepID=A0AAD4HSR3_9AGAM|nr:uncharacterized protein F5891DRAFT_1181506 [Suillus fuscotomentosus]KAG1907211.1 hypothetical protein F5891DRAFT_1181506 [Suillus fuscotomentosus]